MACIILIDTCTTILSYLNNNACFPLIWYCKADVWKVFLIFITKKFGILVHNCCYPRCFTELNCTFARDRGQNIEEYFRKKTRYELCWQRDQIYESWKASQKIWSSTKYIYPLALFNNNFVCNLLINSLIKLRLRKSNVSDL